MNFTRILIIHLILLTGISSCTISEQVGSFQVEIVKPAIFNIPEDVKSVAIINRDILESDKSKVDYIKQGMLYVDSTIRYSDLSNYCIDSLARYLYNEGYFSKVINYRDSLKQSFKNPYFLQTIPELLKTLGTDACICLDFFHFNTSLTYDYGNRFYTIVFLKWSIALKNDTSSYVYNQHDTLVFENREFTDVKFKPVKDRFIEASKNLGGLFGTKLIPYKLTVDRLFYKSNNQEMVKAQEFALNNDWLKAAEIWNRLATNKNDRIATKAMYNMALACEMEGKPDLAINWLVKSYSGLKRENTNHKANCQRYINVLALRKLEIARLEKQIR